MAIDKLLLYARAKWFIGKSARTHRVMQPYRHKYYLTSRSNKSARNCMSCTCVHRYEYITENLIDDRFFVFFRHVNG